MLPFFSTVDDEDELLYGDSDISMAMGMSLNASSVKEEPKTDEPMETETVAEKEVTPTYWAAVAREDGTLEVSIVLF